MFSLDNIKSTIEIIIIVAPFVAGIILWIIKHFIKVHTGLKIIEKMYAEFKPNGGGSLFDRIKRIEDEILKSKSRTLVLLSVHNDGVYECDSLGNCIWTNKALQEIFGLTENELLGNGWLLAIDENDRIEVWNDWQECIQKNIPYQHTYTVVNKHTNRYFICETCATAHKDEKGRILGYFGIVKILKEITNEQNIHSIQRSKKSD